ncbi:hypothetical protein GY45DRAFT_718390 [Cubamyces sp. BRFM 1775]|nr:hypothetical protein GY45DRAFT_718390 [Cubamyces sp. BRFM 1775]
MKRTFTCCELYASRYGARDGIQGADKLWLNEPAPLTPFYPSEGHKQYIRLPGSRSSEILMRHATFGRLKIVADRPSLYSANPTTCTNPISDSWQPVLLSVSVPARFSRKPCHVVPATSSLSRRRPPTRPSLQHDAEKSSSPSRVGTNVTLLRLRPLS